MKAPNQCFVELTQKCNLHCKHCFANADNNENHMSLETYKHVAKELYNLGVIWIGLTGGETLLNPQFTEIMEYSKKYMKAQEFTLLSNGLLWNDTILYALDPGRLNIQISLDGASYESYLKLRGGNMSDFETIVRTFKNILNHNFHTTAFFTATNKTLNVALDTAKFALEELGVHCFQVAPLFVAGRAIDNFKELEFLKEEWKEFVIKATEIKRDRLWGERSERFKVSFFTLYEFLLPLLEAGMENEVKTVWGFDKHTFSKHRKSYCEAAQTDLAIDWQGRVFPCVPAMRTEFVAGDLTTNSLDHIWRESSTLNWFRNSYEEVIKKEPCKSCDIKDICGGGCRISAYYLTGDKYAPDPRCPKVGI